MLITTPQVDVRIKRESNISFVAVALTTAPRIYITYTPKYKLIWFTLVIKSGVSRNKLW